jgi:xylose isomerase
MAGAATNPDPDVFAYAAGQVKNVLEVTHELGGANYVLWGGREGYETLLNTRIRQEQDQAARFLSLVIDHAKKIGFKGTILIEPKPQEPTKHQYDYDVATVYGFLKTYGLEKEVKVNIEVGHAFLAGHSFEHEIALAGGLGILGSVDANRNDLQSGWDTDQFPNNPGEMALAFYHILKAGGLGNGGFNFDAKVRRQSLDPADLLHGHAGGLDILARGLKGAAALIEDGTYDKAIEARYAGWQTPEAQAMLNGQRSLADIAARVERDNINPQPRSGQQEYLENLVNRFV